MSDPRQMMQGRPPMPMGRMPPSPGPRPGMPSGGPQKPQDALEQNRSMFNPTDLAAMVQKGELTPQTTVREMFQKMGVDVDGPITQLASAGQDQMQKADILTKMQKMGQGTQGQPPGPPMGGQPPGEPGLSGLMSKLGG